VVRLYLVRHGKAAASFSEARDPLGPLPHFVAINRVVVFGPDHASVTVLDVEDGGLRLVRLGAARPTPVL
jgi:hypothetical protein